MKKITTKDNGKLKVETICTEKPIVIQSAKKECDINYLFKKHKKISEIPYPERVAQYGDFSEVGDFTDALEKVEKANKQFDELGVEIKKRFRNNPAELLAFLENIENKEEAIKLGLVEKEPKETDTPVVVEEPETPPVVT